MEMRGERNLYNVSRLRATKQTYQSKSNSNWHMFRNYKSKLSFADSFSFKKSPRKKKKTDDSTTVATIATTTTTSTNSLHRKKESRLENVDSCGILKPKDDDCQDLIFDKENDDLIFEGLTAVMKKAILDNPKVLEFITKVLPTYPGLATIMLPNQVIALYGSWSVIKQARQQLLNLSGLHEQDVSEAKDKKGSSLLKEESCPPVLSPQKYNPYFPVLNKTSEKINELKSVLKKDESKNQKTSFSSSSSSTVAAADSSSSSHNNKSKTSDKKSSSNARSSRMNSSDSEFSLPSPVPNEELDLSTVVFHTTPLKSVARSGRGPFAPSTVNGSVDSDTDCEGLPTASSQVTSKRRSTTKHSSKGMKLSNKQATRETTHFNPSDERKIKNKNVHVVKKRKGLAIGKLIGGRQERKDSKLKNSYLQKRLLRKETSQRHTAQRQDSGGGSEDEEGHGVVDGNDEYNFVDDDDEEEEEEEVVEEEDDDDDWATCAATSCSLKDRRDVTDIVWLQCEGCDTWWHCLCARLGDLTEDEASSLDFTCSFCLAPKTRQSVKRKDKES